MPSKKRRLFLVVAASLLAGSASALSNPPGGPGDSCGMARYAYLMGQHRRDVAKIGFTQPVRIIRQNDRVTQDYVPNRINFVLDGNRRVERIYCG